MRRRCQDCIWQATLTQALASRIVFAPAAKLPPRSFVSLPEQWHLKCSASKRDMSKTAANPIDSAKYAGLRYISGEIPGITRRKKGRGFAYFTADGALVRQDATLKRIRSLVIPPAWSRVWICP